MLSKQDNVFFFNVKSLFTNIPVSFIIQLIIIDAISHNKSSDSNASFNGFNQTKMQQFLEWVTKSFTFFYNEYIEQIDGFPIGGKASNMFADAIMNFIVDKAVKIIPSQYQPYVMYNFVDDCFSFINDKIQQSLKFFRCFSR